MYRVACILKNTDTNKFHPAIFDGKPLPGNIDEIGDVQLVSEKHHQDGFDSIDDAIAVINNLDIDKDNICTIPLEWDGEPGLMWLLPNWKARGSTITASLSEAK